MIKTVKFSLVSVMVLAVAFLTLSCEDDLRTDPVVSPAGPMVVVEPSASSTDSTETDTPLDDFPPICYRDSVWIELNPNYTICCVPLDDEWFYCYSRYEEGFAFAAGLFKNGVRYKYHYCNDGSDSLLLAEHGFSGSTIAYLLARPHVCMLEYVEAGKSAPHTIEKAAFIVRGGGVYCDVILDYYEDFSIDYPDDRWMTNLMLSHVML